MKYYPAFLKVKDRRCVVVGGGEVAERKVHSLLECGAVVTVISFALSLGLQDLAAQGIIRVIQRGYLPGDLDQALIAIAATDDAETNHRVAQEGEETDTLVNVVDDAENCDFILPAVACRGDLVMAVSTSGRSPALARRIRQELEQEFLPQYEELLSLLSELRTKLQQEGKHLPPAFWQERLVPELLPLIRQGNYLAARDRLTVISDEFALKG